jgi:hypothetical protein
MLNFKRFINLEEALELPGGKLKHLEHVEDRAIDSGTEGFEHTTRVLNAVHNHMLGGYDEGINITQKHDGAPSVVFGRDPKNGKFFVASKSAFNKNPKINYTEADIEKNHGHAPGLVDKLKAALKHLPKVAPKEGVYQGDFMYERKDLQQDPQGNYFFKPNLVGHTVDPNSAEGQKVARAKMGLVVHTKYEGKSLDDMQAGFDVDHESFGQHPDVHMIDPRMQFSGQYTPEQQKAVTDNIKKASEYHKRLASGGYDALQDHAMNIKTYMNDTVRKGTTPSVGGYQKFLAAKGEAAAGTVKTAKSKQQKLDQYQALINHSQENRDHFTNLFAMHHHLEQAKNHLVDALSTNPSDMQYSINEQPSIPEGFVATIDGIPNKLVKRRSGFSEANFKQGAFQKGQK